MSPLETPQQEFARRLELAGIATWPALGRALDVDWSQPLPSEMDLVQRDDLPAELLPRITADTADDDDGGGLSGGLASICMLMMGGASRPADAVRQQQQHPRRVCVKYLN